MIGLLADFQRRRANAIEATRSFELMPTPAWACPIVLGPDSDDEAPKEHSANDPTCWCIPRIEVTPHGVKLLFHRTFTG